MQGRLIRSPAYQQLDAPRSGSPRRPSIRFQLAWGLPLITVVKLTAGYGKLEILQNLSMSFGAQQFSAVLGPNGSGKSTLMKAIMGVNTIFNGSVQLAGRDLTGMPTEAIAGLGIAYVPQRENIFDELTVLENLQLGMRSLPRDSRARRPGRADRTLPDSRAPARAAGWLAQRRRTSDAGDRHRLAEPAAAHAPR